MGAGKIDEPGGSMFPWKRAEKKRWLMVADPNLGRAQETALWAGGLYPATLSPSPYPWHHLLSSHKRLSAIVSVPVTFKTYHNICLLPSVSTDAMSPSWIPGSFIMFTEHLLHTMHSERVRLGPTHQEHCPPLGRKWIWTGWVNCWIMHFWLFATLHSIHIFNSNVLIT